MPNENVGGDDQLCGGDEKVREVAVASLGTILAACKNDMSLFQLVDCRLVWLRMRWRTLCLLC